MTRTLKSSTCDERHSAIGACRDRRTAIDDDRLARDEAPRPAREHDGRAGDFVGLADAAERIGRYGLRVHSRILPQSAREIGADDAGGNAVRSDIVATPFDREIAGKLEVCRLGKAIDTELGVTFEAANRGYDDHDAVLPCRHARQYLVAKPEIALHVGIHDLVVGILSDAGHRAVIGIDRGIADEDIDFAPMPDRAGDEGVEFLTARDIAGDCDGLGTRTSDGGRHLFACARLAARDHDLGAVIRHRFRDRLADTPCRAGDHGDLAGKIEEVFVHGVGSAP